MKGLRITAAALIMGTMFSFPGSASFLNGNELYSRCNSTQSTVNSTFCVGYISGVFDGIRGDAIIAGRDDGLRCVPVEVNIGQMRDIVVEFLRKNPGIRHLPADILIKDSLLATFTCRARR